MHDAVMHARCTWVHNVHRSVLVLQNSLEHEPGSGVVSTKQRSPTLELQQKWMSQFEESSQARLTAECNCPIERRADIDATLQRGAPGESQNIETSISKLERAV
jgi:hypothetical protein